MPINSIDLDEVETLSVMHPRDAPTLKGRHFVTPWFRVDPERSDAFMYGTYLDSYPHPYVGTAAYGEGLVEGFHLVGMLDFLYNQALWSDGPWVAWNYGLDHVRFVSVVRTSDEFRLRGRVDDVIDRGSQGHLLVLEIIGEVRGRERPGFVATQRLLWKSSFDASDTATE